MGKWNARGWIWFVLASGVVLAEARAEEGVRVKSERVWEGRSTGGRLDCLFPGLGGRTGVLIITRMGNGVDARGVNVEAREAETGEGVEVASEVGTRSGGVVEVRDMDPPQGHQVPEGEEAVGEGRGRKVGETPLVPGPERAKRGFWIIRREGDLASAANYGWVECALRARGNRLRVYVDSKDLGQVGDEVLEALVGAFERAEEGVGRLVGTCRDVDGDGVFTVVFTSAMAALGKGKGGVDGLFKSADLDESVGAPYGNASDVLFLNPRLKPGAQLETVVAHEYTHAALASVKRGSGHEENWLDEAIAHVVEELVVGKRTNIDHRVAAYLEEPSRYGLVVADYYKAGLFRSHGHRGAAYLFLRWCVDQFGEGLVGELARAEERGAENLERCAGVPFEELVARWSTAMATGEGYRSLNLRGEFGGYQLRGPHEEPLEVGGRGVAWKSAPTASRYFRVVGSGEGAVRVTASVEGDGELIATWVEVAGEELAKAGVNGVDR